MAIKSVAALDYPAATNLGTNGGVEVDTTSWQAQGTATVARVTTTAKFGTASLRVITAAENASGARWHLDGGDRIPVTAGVSYAATFWARLDEAGSKPLGVNLNWYDSGGNFLSNDYVTTGNVLATTDWSHRLSATVTAPANATHLAVDINTSGDQGVFTMYLDGAQLEVAPASPYIETVGSAASRAASITQRPLNGVNVSVG